MNEHDQKAIELFLKATDPAGEQLYWIGLTDLFEEGTWVWEPSHEHAKYFNWAENEPTGFYENFAHLLNASMARKWNDCSNDICYDGVYALCQITL